MYKRFPTKAIFTILTGLIVLVFACSCTSSNDQVDGDEDNTDVELESEPCDNGDLKCSGNVVLICQANIWEELKDCEELQLVCNSGRCIEDSTDGDEELDDEIEEDLDTEDGDEEIEEDIESPPDNLPPEVISTSPSNDAVGVDIGLSKVAINFNEEVDVSEVVWKRDIDILGGCVRAIFTGTLSTDKKQVQLNILYVLEEGMTYQAVIKADKIKDLAGNYFAGTTVSFTTDNGSDGDVDVDCEIYTGDTTPPEVLYTIPDDNQYAVDLNLAAVRITFTEKLRRADYILTEQVSVTGDNSHQPELGFEFEDNRNTITNLEETTLIIKLKEELNPDTAYTVILKEGLTDVAMNPLGQYQMSFSTADDPNTDGDAEVDGDEELEEDEDKEIEPFNSARLLSTRHILGDCPPAENETTALSYEWTPSDVDPYLGQLKILHEDVLYDLSLTDIQVRMVQDIWTITLTETEVVLSPAEEDCLFDVEFVIDYLLEGTYTIIVKSGNGDPDLQIEAVIDYDLVPE